jgi:GNAT superfamily N-acetyltransferase
MALQTLDRKSGFMMVKTIDGIPRANGTTSIMNARVWHYAGGPTARQTHYESIGSAIDLQRQLIIAQRLPDCKEPRVLQDSHILVVEVFKGAHTADRGIIRHPKPGEPSLGLHAVAIEGYDEATETIGFWNSWGSSWGLGGYGEISFQYAEDFYTESFVTRYAGWGPTPAKLQKMFEAVDLREYRRLWSIENPRLTYRIPGPGDRNSKYRRYESVSPTSSGPVTCLEIATGFGLLMGWAFLRHLKKPKPVTQVTELFVWPTFRGLGIARRLESKSVKEALKQQSHEIHLLINEADAVVGPPRAAARKFAADCGYQMRWRNRVGPRSPATAIKMLNDCAE